MASTRASLIRQTKDTLPINQGGTGQVTKTTAFNALSPTTSKGDLEVNNGVDVVRLAVGADNLVLMANSSSPEGVVWNDVAQGIFDNQFDTLVGDIASSSITVPHSLGVVPKKIRVTALKAVSNSIIAHSWAASTPGAGSGFCIYDFQDSMTPLCITNSKAPAHFFITDDVTELNTQTMKITAATSSTFTITTIKVGTPNANLIHVLIELEA